MKKRYLDRKKQELPTEIDSNDDLISVVKTLLQIRSNYEKKFGVIMYANGDTKKIEKITQPLSAHNYAKERGSTKCKTRNIAIKQMRDSGYTYKDIGMKFGLSISQCRSVVVLELRNEKNGYR